MSTTAPDLLIELDRSRPRRLRAQIEGGLRDAISAGRLAPGTSLPSTRALAADLGVTRGVVVAAYDQLLAEGYLLARQGAGTVVNSAPVGTDRAVVAGRPRPAPAVIDFRPSIPELSTFPRAAWLRATRAALHALPDRYFGYSNPRGLPQLRRAVAEYLGRVRGVVADTDQVVICNGFAHGLSLVARQLLDTGHTTFAVEDPGHGGQRAELAFARRQRRSGAGRRRRHRRRAAPTLVRPRRAGHAGAPVPHRRRALAAAPAGTHRLGPRRRRLRHRGRLRRRVPLRPAPGGGDAGPRPGSGDLLRDVVEEPGPRAAARLARAAVAARRPDRRQPDADRPRHVRLRCRRRSPSSSATATSTATCGGCGGSTGSAATSSSTPSPGGCPDATLSGIAAGLHVLVTLPPGTDDEAVVAQAADRGVRIYPLGEYRVGEDPRRRAGDPARLRQPHAAGDRGRRADPRRRRGRRGPAP